MDLLWYLKFVQRVGDELLELIITIAWCMCMCMCMCMCCGIIETKSDMVE